MNHLITDILLAWYRSHKRDLPWRHTRDPYHIWVSEIILQQTRVAQGMAYYHRFIHAFPDIFYLAQASVEQVLKIWEGLGYYSRARNMHVTAQSIVNDYGGTFPDSYEGLLMLKGIGPYTAAAIASISFQKPVPVVDGNVFRVLSRLYVMPFPAGKAGGKKEALQKANELMPVRDPGEFNQAMMEFGALQCVPDKPDCNVCPLQEVCMAQKKGKVDLFPGRAWKPGVVTRYLHYFVIIGGGKTVIRQRKKKDIWYLLYDFPGMETKTMTSPEQLIWDFIKENELPETWGKGMIISEIICHHLTHQTIYARFYHVENETWFQMTDDGSLIIPLDDLKKYAFPRLITAYMESYPERFGKKNR